MKGWQATRPFLVLAVLCLLPTWQFLFGGKVPAPIDQVHRSAPWISKPPSAPFDVLQADGALQFLPWRDLMLEIWRQGNVPLWNHYSLGGVPFLANSQSAVLYPLHPIAAVTGMSATELMRFSAWLHLWIAACGVYLLCRKLGATELGGLIGGSGFAMSAFMIAWIQLPSVGMTAAWIPWCLLGVSKIANDQSLKSVVSLAIPIAFMFLAGHLQIAAYGMMATVLFAIWTLTEFKNWKRAIPMVLGILFGIGLAAPQLLPSLENGKNGHRSGPATAEGYDVYKKQAVGLHHAVTLFAPSGFGMPNQSFSDEDNQNMSAYWLGYSEPGRHYAELAFYVGPVLLPLALAGLIAFRKKRSIGFFGFLAGFSLLFALGTFLTQLMFFGIPGWSATGSPGRILVLFSLSVCILGGSSIREETIDSKFAIIFSGCIVFVGSLISMLWLMGLNDSLQAKAAIESVPIALIGLVGCSVAIFALTNQQRFPAIILCLVLSVATSWYVHRGVNLGADSKLVNEVAPGISELKQIIGINRIAVINEGWNFMGPLPNGFGYPNTLLPERIREIGGYDSLIPKVRKETLDEINGQDSAPPVNGNMMLIKPGFDTERLSAIGVNHLVSKIPLPIEPMFQENNWAVYALPIDPKAPVTVSETPNGKVIRTGGNLPLEAQIPGWTWFDGKNWVELNSDSRLPIGEEIKMEYRPGSFKNGIFMFLASVLGLIAIYCIRVKNSNADRTDTAASS